jgi:RNA recognition motif-containing protein
MTEKQITGKATQNSLRPDQEELPASCDSKERKLAGVSSYLDHKKLAKSWRIIVRNVSFKTTEEQLKVLLEPFGTVWEVALIKKPGQSHHSGFAFVQFAARSQATKAIQELNGKLVGDREIALDYALPKDSYEKYRTEVSRQSGLVAKPTQKFPKKVPRKVHSTLDRKSELERTVFVRNISFDTEEGELREL